MATDVSRVSFDPARQYTRVLSQQGRVMLEAEENEDGRILAEERRHDLLDLVGPAATPDDGYALAVGADGGLLVEPGTMYVGGNRVVLDAETDYAAQPDWLDHDGDPEWSPVPAAADGKERGGVDHVVLEVAETDVTAAEDPVLREAALGGPDGAARGRLLQHVRRMATDARDCEGAMADAVAAWADEGLVFDAATAELRSGTRLLAAWDAPPEPADPCEPASRGGYLGADNQAIRVQVVRRDPDHADRFDLVWGYDDASMLYRVTADASAQPVLTLARSPVDDLHRPRAGQAVQVLRSAAALASTDAVVEGYAASLDGPVAVLTAPYDPDAKTVLFPAALPAQATDPAATPQLYLRVWEEVVTGVSAGDAVTLTGTGLQVTLSLDGVAAVHPGDFWVVGVRPATPDTVLPARLLRVPQPPDGPRAWACPLGVIAWTQDGFDLLDDCRVPFTPVTEGGCCTIRVGPHDAGRLQRLIDAAAARRPAPTREHRITICLEPGRYRLPRTLLLERRHGHLHLEGCGEGVLLAAEPGREKAFVQGLIALVHADNVRLSGLELELPLVPSAELTAIDKADATVRVFRQQATAMLSRRTALSVGVRPVHCAELEIERCLFRFVVGPRDDERGQGAQQPAGVVGVGIFAASECWGLTLSGNRFLHGPLAPATADQEKIGAPRVLVGVLLAPAAVRGEERSAVRSLLERGRFAGNEFHGLTVATAVLADLGEIALSGNVVRECHGGVWLLAMGAQSLANVVGDVKVHGVLEAPAARSLAEVLDGALADPILTLLALLARAYPLPAEERTRLVPHTTVAKVSERDRAAFAEEFAGELSAPFATEGTTHQRTLALARMGRERAGGELEEAVLDVDRGLLIAGSATELRLRVTDNDLDCAAPEQGRAQAATGAALLVYGGRGSTRAAAVVTGNRMRASNAGAVTALASVPAVAVTGNAVRNEDKGASVALVGCREVAVTGNVAVGRGVLPPRPGFAAPLDDWATFNSGM